MIKRVFFIFIIMLGFGVLISCGKHEVKPSTSQKVYVSNDKKLSHQEFKEQFKTQEAKYKVKPKAHINKIKMKSDYSIIVGIGLGVMVLFLAITFI